VSRTTIRAHGARHRGLETRILAPGDVVEPGTHRVQVRPPKALTAFIHVHGFAALTAAALSVISSFQGDELEDVRRSVTV
jgi:hypothetical protein